MLSFPKSLIDAPALLHNDELNIVHGATKRSRSDITAEQKRELCRFKENNPKATQSIIQTHFKEKWGILLGRSTISGILRDRIYWLSLQDSEMNFNKRKKKCQQPELELRLVNYYQECNVRGIPLTNDMMMQQAKQLGSQLGIEDFAYSPGWYERFKRRNSIRIQSLSGKKQQASINREFSAGLSLLTLTTPINKVHAANTYSLSQTPHQADKVFNGQTALSSSNGNFEIVESVSSLKSNSMIASVQSSPKEFKADLEPVENHADLVRLKLKFDKAAVAISELSTCLKQNISNLRQAKDCLQLVDAMKWSIDAMNAEL